MNHRLLVSIYIMLKHGQRRGHKATVVFEALAGAEAACDTLHGEDFPGSKRWSKRWITVTKARPPVAKAEGSPVDGPERRLLEMERRLGERECRSRQFRCRPLLQACS